MMPENTAVSSRRPPGEKKAASDEYVRLSESRLWHRMKAFYKEEGIGAWDQKVPFYATGNPYIADAYANIIGAYIRDAIQDNAYNPQQPFMIIELGAGSGIFAFYFLQRLTALLDGLHLQETEFVYVMTDCARTNLDFWETHPAFQGYIRSGCLDFALFDVETDRKMNLSLSGRVLDPDGTGRNGAGTPMIALANYLFDTIPMDLFEIRQGNLFEGKVPKDPSGDLDFPNNTSISFDLIGSPVSYEKTDLPYYENPPMDAVLSDYLDSGQDGYLAMPTAGMKGIETLIRLSSGNLLLALSDKGFARHHELFSFLEPDIAFHDSAFSMMVNFDAVGRFFKQLGGDAFHQTTQQGIATSVFVAGTGFSGLKTTRVATDTHLNTFSPGDLFNVYNHILGTKLECSLETLISYLNMTHWDPQVFNLHLDLILTLIKTANYTVIKDLAEGLPKVADNFYYMPGCIDTLSNIGLVLQEVQLYREAIPYYHNSLEHFGESEIVYYNLGLCHTFLQENTRAVEFFRKAVLKHPDYILAKGWLSHIKDMMQRDSGLSPWYEEHLK